MIEFFSLLTSYLTTYGVIFKKSKMSKTRIFDTQRPQIKDETQNTDSHTTARTQI